MEEPIFDYVKGHNIDKFHTLNLFGQNHSGMV